jgi:hypothetical protein
MMLSAIIDSTVDYLQKRAMILKDPLLPSKFSEKTLLVSKAK